MNLDGLREEVFEERLAILRISNHYSQENLAEQLNMDAKAYAKYEQGKTIPPTKRILDLAQIYNISTDYILTGKHISTNERLSALLEKYSPDKQEHIIKIVEAMLSMMEEK